jgi:hypothetical protein
VIKRILSLIVFLLVVNAAYHVGMVYFHDQQFKDSCRELAILASQPPGKTDEVLRAKVMDLAQENQIPLDPDYLEITRRSAQGLGEKITIKFAYAVNIAFAPGFSQRVDFSYVTP